MIPLVVLLLRILYLSCPLFRKFSAAVAAAAWPESSAGAVAGGVAETVMRLSPVTC